MNIQTKFDLDSIVYYLYQNKVHKGIVTRIEAITSKESAKIEYKAECNDCSALSKCSVWIVYEENRLFASKEELLADLLNPKTGD